MKITHTLTLIALGATLLATNGCLTDFSGSSYDAKYARMQATVYYGTIIHIGEAKIEGSQSGAGAIGGGIVGAAVGNTIGGGSGKTLATAGGAVLGALLGNAAEHGMTSSKALEIEVKLDDNDKPTSVTQAPGKDEFFVGQRVRVYVYADGSTRVRP